MTRRATLSLAVRRNHVGQLAPLGNFALAVGDGVLFGFDDLGAHRLNGGERRGMSVFAVENFRRVIKASNFDQIDTG
jgi:hypothetical protein